jgi:hypothetical protein
MHRLIQIVFSCAVLICAGALAAQESPPPLTKEQVEQLVAPVALYPDSLLSQVLMAATYPADVAEAAKWSKANPKQKGEDAVKAVESQAWDPSVKSLVAFPQLMTMMGEKPDWVQNLGDAFLASSKDVLDAAQRLRAKAEKEGNLKSGKEQTVSTVNEGDTTIIQIAPAQPSTVYVPTYDPMVVYGPWPYPAYPPYSYYPPGYMPGAAFWGFASGVAVGAALWGNCDWGHGDVDIDVNKYNNINKNKQIDRSKNKFEHNRENRRGTPYRDQTTRDRFNRDVPGASDRQGFRGHDSARDAQRRQAESALKGRGMDPGMERDRLRNDPQVRDRAQAADRSFGDHGSFGDRGGAGDHGSFGDRGGRGGDSAFSGIGNGRDAQRDMDRGRESFGSRGDSGRSSSFGGGDRGGRSSSAGGGGGRSSGAGGGGASRGGFSGGGRSGGGGRGGRR